MRVSLKCTTSSGPSSYMFVKKCLAIAALEDFDGTMAQKQNKKGLRVYICWAAFRLELVYFQVTLLSLRSGSLSFSSAFQPSTRLAKRIVRTSKFSWSPEQALRQTRRAKIDMAHLSLDLVVFTKKINKTKGNWMMTLDWHSMLTEANSEWLDHVTWQPYGSYLLVSYSPVFPYLKYSRAQWLFERMMTGCSTIIKVKPQIQALW